MPVNLDDLLPQKVASPEAAQPQKNWSPYQQEVFKAVKDTRSNLLVQAVAGSGKTTTIVEAMRHESANALFLAFNKSIATELQQKIPVGREARTFNSLGHSALYRMIPRTSKLDTWKIRNLLKEHVDAQVIPQLQRVIGLAKHNAVGILDPGEVEWFLNRLEQDPDLDPEGLAAYADAAHQVFWKSLDCEASFDFDDQVYLPVYHNRSLGSPDVVFVDEAQDLSPIQHLMLARLNARTIAVGDRAQAIYGFRGADENSMDSLKQRFDMLELPLSITYRVPEKIAMLARSRVPDLEWAKSGGKVEWVSVLPQPSAFGAESMVICRNNAPLFRLGLEFIRARVPCKLMTAFGQELTKFISKLEGTTSAQAIKSLYEWRDRQLEKARSDTRITAIHERVECVEPFLREFKLKIQAGAALTQIIASETGTRICTIHKSKGLEARHVFFLQPELLKMEFIQEQNLYYVGVTRALEELTIYSTPENVALPREE